MHLVVNGKPRLYDGPPSLAALLTALEVDRRRVAVARNGEVLRREEYAQVELQDGDNIEIVHMVGGGAPPGPVYLWERT